MSFWSMAAVMAVASSTGTSSRPWRRDFKPSRIKPRVWYQHRAIRMGSGRNHLQAKCRARRVTSRFRYCRFSIRDPAFSRVAFRRSGSFMFSRARALMIPSRMLPAASGLYSTAMPAAPAYSFTFRMPGTRSSPPRMAASCSRLKERTLCPSWARQRTRIRPAVSCWI